MVQEQENLTRISGTVVSRSPDPSQPDYDQLTVLVQSAEPIPGKADHLSRQIGKEIQVAVRRDLLGNAGPGSKLSCRAKNAFGNAICEKDPPSGEFSIGPT